jgi:hypothetical protein
MEEKESSEPSEEKGIEMIIYLQSKVGITETPEDARRGWQAMTLNQKMQTLMAYNMLQ